MRGHPNEPKQPKKGWSWDQIWSNHINNIIPLITLPIVWEGGLNGVIFIKLNFYNYIRGGAG